MYHRFPRMTAEEAAAQIPNGATVAFSGFGPAGPGSPGADPAPGRPKYTKRASRSRSAC